MKAEEIFTRILELGRSPGVTNSQFRKEVESMVILHLKGKDVSGLSRKDRVKVMTNSHECLDAYLVNEKKKAHQEDNPNW